MSSFKEIVTKAVVGKGKKSSASSYQLQTEEVPNTVLGCWVINHRFHGQNSGGKVLITGSFDVNVWYSYDHDSKTAVSTKRFNYEEKMNIHLKDNNVLTDNSEIIVRSLKQPAVTDVKINNGIVEMEIEKELGIEIVGDTKVKVSVEDDEDEYEDIFDEDEIEEEIDTTVAEDHLIEEVE